MDAVDRGSSLQSKINRREYEFSETFKIFSCKNFWKINIASGSRYNKRRAKFMIERHGNMQLRIPKYFQLHLTRGSIDKSQRFVNIADILLPIETWISLS